MPHAACIHLDEGFLGGFGVYARTVPEVEIFGTYKTWWNVELNVLCFSQRSGQRSEIRGHLLPLVLKQLHINR
jgi:hypothetical protein